MASKSLNDLTPEMKARAQDFLALVYASNMDVLIYCTYRSDEEQARLFRQGRTLAAIQHKADELAHEYRRPDLAAVLMGVGPQSGHKLVTWAGPGQSLHGYRVAFDFCPIIDGKPVWSPVDIEATPDVDEGELWMKCGDLVRSAGLQWAGDWPKGKREFPHAQLPGVDWRKLIVANNQP